MAAPQTRHALVAWLLLLPVVSLTLWDNPIAFFTVLIVGSIGLAWLMAHRWNLLATLLAWPPAARAVIRYARWNHAGCHIPPESGEYMERNWIVNPPVKYGGAPIHSWLPFEIRVHHIKRADNDRHRHDHPWNWRSIVLSGWYVEDTKRELTLRLAGDVTHRDALTPHRITQVSPGGVYTLFITGRRTNSWGFYTENGKVNWRDYLGYDE